MPNPTLEAVYRTTDYRVYDGPHGPFVIRIGEPCPAADRVLADHRQTDWAFVTACNPGSARLPAAQNARRMAALEELCDERGWMFFRGAGVGRDGAWPPEPSFWLVGVPEFEAVELARHFGQNAIVAGRWGEPARLVWVV